PGHGRRAGTGVRVSAQHGGQPGGHGERAGVLPGSADPSAAWGAADADGGGWGREGHPAVMAGGAGGAPDAERGVRVVAGGVALPVADAWGAAGGCGAGVLAVGDSGGRKVCRITV